MPLRVRPRHSFADAAGNFVRQCTNDSSKLIATVSDFTLGQDKVAVFAQNVTKDNLSTYVQASSYNTSSTKLVVDLDGAGAGNTVNTLYLQNLAYNPGNTHTIFGV